MTFVCSDYWRVHRGHGARMVVSRRSSDREESIDIRHSTRRPRVDRIVHAARRHDRMPADRLPGRQAGS